MEHIVTEQTESFYDDFKYWEQQFMVIKDLYADLARAAGSPCDSWFGDPLEKHDEVLARIVSLAEKATRYDGLCK
jgi:hypothetical protein